MNYLIFHRAWLENICCKTSNYILSSSLLHSRKQPQVLHFILWISPVKLSTRFDSEVVTEVVADLMLSISFILHVIIAFIKFRSLLIFTTSFSLGQKRSYNFHFFCKYTRIDHQTHLPILWLWNENHTLIHYDNLQWFH